MFHNEVLRMIFRPTRREVAGGRRQLHNDELHFIYSSSKFTNEFHGAGSMHKIDTHSTDTNPHKILYGQREGRGRQT